MKIQDLYGGTGYESNRGICKEVEEKCKSKNNIFGYGILSHNILSVVKYSKILVERIDADVEVVEIAALAYCNHAMSIDDGAEWIYGIIIHSTFNTLMRDKQEAIALIFQCKRYAFAIQTDNISLSFSASA